MVMRTELNGNEKLAQVVNGMESTGTPIVVNGRRADEILATEKKEKFNTQVNEYADKFEKHNKALQDYASELSKDMNNLEILPMGGYALIKPFDNNPFQRVKVENGIITDLGGFAPTYKSQEDGQVHEEEQYIRVGTVIETGWKCEFLKPGDVVFYTIASEAMVPFFKQGFVVVAESRIMAVINEKLTERKNQLVNGNKD
nr:MAG TPA: mHsp60, mHsp10, Mitochondrial, Chaperonin, Complex, Symmetric [Bacteriophage sp.]